MMYTGFGTECDSSSRCSSASPAGDNITYYPSPAESYSSVGSPMNQAQSTNISPKPSIFSASSGAEPSTMPVKMSDLEHSLEDSLELLESLKKTTETARSVPDMDLSGSFYAPEWEPLYSSATTDAEPLCTPVVTCTPTCTTYTSSFVFTYPESESIPTCGVAHRRGSSSNEQSSDSLSSPTLLAL
ncbi:hypothetical protein Z043_117490 [Scleropages formosus]|uniref:Uncharacterized protein n=1 Tax=Scleropages formosus TaxID=113540 RepID=A0A0P7YD30_SCLFO|nr:hypothetical protein Z043_117490 [Scleropages formosus]